MQISGPRKFSMKYRRRNELDVDGPRDRKNTVNRHTMEVDKVYRWMHHPMEMHLHFKNQF